MNKTIIIFIVATLLAVLIIGERVIMNSNNEFSTLKVAFPSSQKIEKYEPTQISLDYEYILLENIYSPLVEINRDGFIESGVAEKYEWVGDELKLTIRKSLSTLSGKRITPDDVLFSLKRLLILSGNTHGNFKDIVCPSFQLKSLNEPCEGIRADEDAVYLKAKGGKSFLLQMISSIDFAIIPKHSVDLDTLKIKDYSETSGVYAFDKQDADGKIYLKINKHHYYYSDKIAQEIVFVPTDINVKGDGLRMLKMGIVDHVTTIDQSRADETVEFANQNKDKFNSHFTQKIRTSYALFSERGLKEFSPEERRYIGEKIKISLSEAYKNNKGLEPRSEFFPPLSEGGLTEPQKKELEIIKNKQAKSINKTVRIGMLKKGDLHEWSTPILAALPTADCYREDNAPAFKKYKSVEDEPHVFIASTDTGFLEDISLTSYALNAGQMGLSKQDRVKWLADYMSNDDKNYRVDKLKKLHFNSLAEPVLVPLMSSPYTALVRKPWKIELSELYANNQLWRIKHD